MLFHVDNVDNFVHNLIFQHFFIFLKVENFLPINSPIHIFFKSLCNLLISTLFDIFPCKISYLQYLTKYTQINFILSLFPFVSWQAPVTVQKGRGTFPGCKCQNRITGFHICFIKCSAPSLLFTKETVRFNISSYSHRRLIIIVGNLDSRRRCTCMDNLSISNVQCHMADSASIENQISWLQIFHAFFAD